ncbi:MAG: tubulin/FtsZ family protein [Haloferacaceae archaeon]
MKLALVGVGQAGGKVVDSLIDHNERTAGNFVAAAVAINTARADLLGLEHVPAERRVLIGQSRVKGHGVGADNELGVEIAREDLGEVTSALDDLPMHEVDAFLVVAGLGGGTGSGAGPVIAERLRELYTEPVYGLGILPARDEGGLYTLNAARSFRTFVERVDNLVVFDNDAWRTGGESVRAGYAAMNDELARRLGLLFNAGEVTEGVVPEMVVDASEVINTLASGGVTTIGYATSRIERGKKGMFGRRRSVTPDSAETVNRIVTTVRRAALGRLTLPANVESADRALVVVAGPPEYLSRKGIEDARQWVEETTGTMEVRGGDYPVPDSEFVAGLVVLSGVSDVPRIAELQQVAVEAQRNIAEIGERADAAFDDLVWSGGDELEPLF